MAHGTCLSAAGEPVLLTARERQLVSLGAALGSNCVPCVQSLVPAAKRAGLTEPQIAEAIRLADQVRRVPARKVIEAAIELLPQEVTTLKPGLDDRGPAAAC